MLQRVGSHSIGSAELVCVTPPSPSSSSLLARVVKLVAHHPTHIRTELCQFASETPQDDVGSHLAHIQNQILA